MKEKKGSLKNESIFGRLIDEKRFDKFLVFDKNSNLASELETTLERNKHSKFEFTYSVYKFLVGPEMIEMKNAIMSLTPTGFEDS